MKLAAADTVNARTQMRKDCLGNETPTEKFCERAHDAGSVMECLLVN